MRAMLMLLVGALVGAHSPDVLPSYHYGAPIHVECMNRSVETSEVRWEPFPACEETQAPLQLAYGVEGEVNCTVGAVSEALARQLEAHMGSEAALACRVPARPRAHAEVVGEAPAAQEYVPLVFALAGAAEPGGPGRGVVVSTRVNVLLHSAAKQHPRARDSGVLDSAVAYSTSPLGGAGAARRRRVAAGDALPLSLSVRWFPTPALPRAEGRAEWQGLGGHVYASTVFYSLVSFGAGALAAAAYCLGVVVPRRLGRRAMGGATPLGGGRIGNGWGYSKRD